MDYDDDAFRAQYPEFGDKEKYTPAKIQGFWNIAIEFISNKDNACSILRGTSRRAALNALTAHLMTLSDQANQGPGGTGAGPGGYETGATIGDVSVQRLAPPVKNGFQFWLSQTQYGQQLWAMLSLLGTGGWSVGGLPERTGFRKIGGVFL